VSATLPLSVREVVTMGRYASRGLFGRLGPGDRVAVDHALERLDIADLARRQLGALSGGQRQRVFVAQGLAQQADVLLLDEPVTGLDLVTQDRILDVVAEERDAGRAVILSTHDLAEASRADQLVLLAGRIVATGTPTEVLTEANLTAAYGGRMVRLPGGAVMLDDASHHAH
jgi:manganese transport system ATP-binding protein